MNITPLVSKMFLLGALLLPFTARAEQNVFEAFFSLQKPEVTVGPVETLDISSPMALRSDCTDTSVPMAVGPVSDNPLSVGLGGAEVVLDSIINIGSKIWPIVQAGKPVPRLDLPTASALPQGTHCWTALENWEAPKSQLFTVSYKNLLFMTVARFDYRLVYTAGGSYNGQGQYLANVTVFPAAVQLMWMFNLDAEVEVGQLINLGTRENPEAGMEIAVKWSVNNPLVHHQYTENYFVRGNGAITKL